MPESEGAANNKHSKHGGCPIEGVWIKSLCSAKHRGVKRGGISVTLSGNMIHLTKKKEASARKRCAYEARLRPRVLWRKSFLLELSAIHYEVVYTGAKAQCTEWNCSRRGFTLIKLMLKVQVEGLMFPLMVGHKRPLTLCTVPICTQWCCHINQLNVNINETHFQSPSVPFCFSYSNFYALISDT